MQLMLLLRVALLTIPIRIAHTTINMYSCVWVGCVSQNAQGTWCFHPSYDPAPTAISCQAYGNDPQYSLALQSQLGGHLSIAYYQIDGTFLGDSTYPATESVVICSTGENGAGTLNTLCSGVDQDNDLGSIDEYCFVAGGPTTVTDGCYAAVDSSFGANPSSSFSASPFGGSSTNSFTSTSTSPLGGSATDSFTSTGTSSLGGSTTDSFNSTGTSPLGGSTTGSFTSTGTSSVSTGSTHSGSINVGTLIGAVIGAAVIAAVAAWIAAHYVNKRKWKNQRESMRLEPGFHGTGDGQASHGLAVNSR